MPHSEKSKTAARPVLIGLDQYYSYALALAPNITSYGMELAYFQNKDIDYDTGTVPARIFSPGKGITPTRKIIHVSEIDILYPSTLNMKRQRLFEANGTFIIWNSYPRKQVINQIFETDPILQKFVIHSEPFSKEAVQNAFASHSELFIKPDLGLKGAGAHTVKKINKNELSVFDGNGNHIESLDEKAFFENYGSKLSRHICQPRILSNVQVADQPCPVVLRVRYRRGAGGRWNHECTYAATGTPGASVANVSQDCLGISITISDFLKRNFPNHHQSIQDELKYIFKEFPRRIERLFSNEKYYQYGFPRISNLAFDFGIDTENNCAIKMFEFGYAAAWRPDLNTTSRLLAEYCAHIGSEVATKRRDISDAPQIRES